MAAGPDPSDRIDPVKRVGEDQQQTQTPTGQQSFGSYMDKAAQQPSAAQPSGVSPFELAKGQPMTAGPNFDTLLNQAKSAQSMLGDINTQLQTPNLKLKQSQRYLLRNKLKDANSYIRTANIKMGAEVNQPTETKGGGIMGKFFDYVNEGQLNLQSAQKQLTNLKSSGGALKPADFLAIQVKMGHAQQEIEFASMMLSNVVSDIKTVMNIQL